MQLLRKMDRAGVLPLERSVEPWESVAAIFPAAAPEAVKSAIAMLVDRGWLIHDAEHGVLVDPEFIEREETPMSDKERQRKSRQSRRDRSTLPSVTKRAPIVTGGHVASQEVTPSVPSYPSYPINPPPEDGEGAFKKLTTSQAEMARLLAVFTAAGVSPPRGQVLGGYGKALKVARETWGETLALDRVIEVLSGISWQNIENPGPYGLKVLNNAITGRLQPIRGSRRGRNCSASQGTLDSAGAFG